MMFCPLRSALPSAPARFRAIHGCIGIVAGLVSWIVPSEAVAGPSGQFQVNVGTAEAQVDPDVAATSDGRFVVVWEDRGGAQGARSEIRGQVYADGRPQSADDLRINAHTSDHQRSPAVAMADDGRFVVVWVGPDPVTSDSSVLARRFDDSGMPLDDDDIVVGTGDQLLDAVVSRAPDGRFAVAWSEHTAVARVIRGRFFAADGTAESPAFQISEAALDGSEARRPSIAFMPESSTMDVIAVWQCSGCGAPDTDGIRGRLFETGSAKEVFSVNTRFAGIQVDPSVAVASADAFFVSWATGGAAPEVWGRLVSISAASNTGVADGSPELRVAEAPAERPDVVSRADGFLVHWRDKLAGGPADPDLVGRALGPTGLPLGNEVRVNTLTGATEFYSALAPTGNGCSVAAWHSLGSSGRDQDSSSIQAGGSGLDVDLTIDDRTARVAPGVSELTYTVVAENVGTEPVAGRMIVDLPDTVSCAADAWERDPSADVVTTAVSGVGAFAEDLELPPSGTIAYTATCSILDSASGPLPASVSFSENGCFTRAVDDDTLIVNADLRVAISDPPDAPLCGDGDNKVSYAFELTVENVGNSNVLAAELENVFPTGLRCKWTATTSGGAIGHADQGNFTDRLVQTLALPVASRVTYDVVCEVEAPGSTQISNRATIQYGDEVEPRIDSDTVEVDLGANLEATVDVSATATPGASYRYFVTVRNLGPADVAYASFLYSPPAGLKCIFDATGAGGGYRDQCGGSLPDTPCDEPSLDEVLDLKYSQGVGYEYECFIAPDANGMLEHTATASSALRQCHEGNNTTSQTTTLVPEADLYVELMADRTTAVPGRDTLSYTLAVGNRGPSTANDIVLTDLFPETLTCVWTSQSQGGAAGNGSGSGLLSDSLTLPPSSRVEYDALCEISPEATGAIDNDASLDYPEELDNNDTDNKASVTTSLEPTADLSITKTNDVTAVAPGQVIQYRIDVTNEGPSAVFDARVHDPFPSSLNCFWWCSPKQSTGAVCSSGLFWEDIDDYVDLPDAGSSVTYHAVCEVVESFSDELKNVATVMHSVTGSRSAEHIDGPPAQFPFTERFSSFDDSIWDLRGSAEIRHGRLNLTSATPHQLGSAVLDAPFASDLDLSIVFDTIIGGGTGGHGLSIFFFDGTAQNALGGAGPCLGYSSGSSCGGSGIPGAYVGIGFDTLGGSSEPGAGADGPGLQPDHVVIRGGAADGYPFLTSRAVPEGIGGYRQVRLWVADQKLTVELRDETDGDPQTLVHLYDLSDLSLPPTLKIGFAATTGSPTDVHQIDNLVIRVPEVETDVGVWTPLDAMSSARSRASLTLLLDGRVLAVGGGTGAEVFDPATGLWSSAGELAGDPITGAHTATLLRSGKVLVVHGGIAQVYDPAADTWARTAAPGTARFSHTATLLPSGEVLVVGGFTSADETTRTASIEVFDPRDETWTHPLDLAEPRGRHTATLARDGTVWIVGGEAEGAGVEPSAERIDPGDAVGGVPPTATRLTSIPAFDRHTATLSTDGTILLTGGSEATATRLDPTRPQPTVDVLTATQQPRIESRATLLPSGQILVAGGFDGDDPSLHVASATAESYDPSLDVWQSHALGSPRASHGMTLLPSGGALVAGGRLDWLGGALVSSEIFWPSGGRWTVDPTLERSRGRRHGHTATLLPTGELLVVGGGGPSGTALDVDRSADLYDPRSATWTRLEDPSTVRRWHTATLLPASSDDLSARVLLVGGDGGTASIALYDHGTGQWQSHEVDAAARRRHTTTLLPDGRVLIVGGESDGEILATAGIYRPATEDWTDVDPLRAPRVGHTATLLPSGRVLVVGGEEASGSVVARTELFDPSTGTWSQVESPGDPRSGHTATVLPSGEVLVAGGRLQGGALGAGAERFDPTTGAWRQTGALATGRYRHTATLLTSGRVLVVGGGRDATHGLQTGELYDPASGSWTSAGALPYLTLFDHTATLLPSGEVLVVSLDGRRYGSGAVPAERDRPQLHTAPSRLRYDRSFDVVGTGFDGDSEAADGTAGGSVGYPLLRLHSIENDRQAWIVPRSVTPQSIAVGDADATLPSYFDLPPIFDPGWHRMTVVTAGVASESKLVHIDCSLEVGEPRVDALLDPSGVEVIGDKVPVGGRARFAVESRGGRQLQWQKNSGDTATAVWSDIVGATASTYLTPPLSGQESGTQYRVRVSSGCREEVSGEVTFAIDDKDPPVARVISPNGGEYWALSTPQIPNVERITFEVTDATTWICGLTIRLNYSNDGGETWLSTGEPVGHDGELPRILGSGAGCERTSAVQSGSVSYSVPESFPSGVEGSLYKIELDVVDHAGNQRTSADVSAHPFYIVPPNDESIRSLILTYPERMGIDCRDSTDAPEVCRKLRELADHPQVDGLVIDLGDNPEGRLAEHYAAWDSADQRARGSGLVEDRRSASLAANRVLFGEGGVQDLVLERTRIFTNVSSILLIGDDRVIPFARVPDRSGLLQERAYTDGDGAELSADRSTVGQAISDSRFLTDDPLATLSDPVGSVTDIDQEGTVFVPDVAIGRLVETSDDIVAAIERFQQTNGLVDLSDPDPSDPMSGPRNVLVTGYDFLADSARIVAEKWRSAYGDPNRVDASLIDDEGGSNSGFDVEALRAAICSADTTYGLINLNGHANHYSEGVPAETWTTIEGLAADELASDTACAGAPLDLGGALIYAVGCHGGLPVPGSDPAIDQSLDLPQVFLRRGALAYIANTGYGWGLREGVGYSEQLIDIFTDQLRVGGDVSVGQAVLDAKLRYFQEARGLDGYSIKTLMQWSTFGFPMARVNPGLDSADAVEVRGRPDNARELIGPAAAVSDATTVDDLGPVTVRRRESGAGTDDPGAGDLPPFLTRAEIGFEVSESSYIKRQADGLRLPRTVEGCPSERGCYYTLNGLGERGTGDTDRPIQPFLLYNSKLAGTSQHGVVWLGGEYVEEANWRPIFAELISNGEDTGANHGFAPQMMVAEPIDTPLRSTSDPDTCRVADHELNTLVVPTGEVRRGALDASISIVADPSQYSIQRRYLSLDVDVLYYNNLDQPTANCDRQGPTGLDSGTHHRLEGTLMTWEVAVDDPSGVWRVVVVYDVRDSDTATDGAWVPVELSFDPVRNAWIASRSFNSGQLVTYVVQAVDTRGNVSWQRFDQQAVRGASNEPRSVTDSGVDPRHPASVPVRVDASADLGVTLSAWPDPVPLEGLLDVAVEVENQGADMATAVVVDLDLDVGVGAVALSNRCSIRDNESIVRCTLDRLDSGDRAGLDLFLRAPGQLGTIILRVEVDSAEDDPDERNNTAAVEIEVDGRDAPPRVVSVTSTPVVHRGLYDASSSHARSGAKQVEAAVTQLRLTFDRPVIGADDTDVFLLVEAGPDRVWQTESIRGGPLGDDRVISFSEIQYEDPGSTVVLDLDGARPLPPGHYRLLAGDGIFGFDLQFLDGDGDGRGGDDFRSEWRVVRDHRLLNPNFDRSLVSWIPVTSLPASVDHAGLDGELVPSSGSAHFVGIRVPEEQLALAQCVAVSPGDRLAFGGRIRLGAAQGWDHLRLSAEVWGAPGCAASPADHLATEVLTIEPSSDGSNWLVIPRGWIDIYEGARSLLLTMVARPASDAQPAELWLDQVELFSSLFGDGFETGDSSQWSSSHGERPPGSP